MIHRQACRALLLSEPENLLLLVRIRIPDRDLEIWITPGGGVESGEAPEDCVIREIHEETGFRVTQCEGPVWIRNHQFDFLGESYDQHEAFYLVRVPHFEPEHRNNPAQHERDLFIRFKWWSIDEIRRSEDTFVPRRLAYHIERLLEGGRSQRPIDVGI